ncbi:MAG: DUF5009 domain-containing protein [Flavobacteriaceae bacterium]|nr:DUF5009 domain-containing protein [Flavobacteriaceae bacterium]
MKNTAITDTSKRLLSIDVLRGFDMLMIIFADHFFYNLHQGAQTGTTAFFAEQFSHPDWFGFHFYDIIMPLFLFVVGAVIPFSMERRVRSTSNKFSLYPHLIRRFVILFILGWVVQGNLLHFDLQKFQVFSNTLQAIAVGYLFTCIAYIHLGKKGRYLLFLGCLLVYTLLLEFLYVPGTGPSELLPDRNIALYIDRLIFGPFDDGYQYTWLLTGLGFTATTLSGLFAGELLKSRPFETRTLWLLTIVGLVGISMALVLHIWHPIVKKIWTSSFVLLSSGICFLLLALFYWIVDIKKYRQWAYPLKVIGMNAITAYVLSHVIHFPSIAKQLLFGLEQFVGPYYDALASIGGFLLLYLLLWYMYKNQTFIKI